MFDFTDYTLNELTAIDNFVCYTRAMAAEHIDLPQIRKELKQLHRSLSRAINARLDEAAEEWDTAHKNITAYKAVVSEPVTPVMAAPPAEDSDDLQSLVDTLSRCSDRLAALALAEGRRFDEFGQMDAFIKLTVLSNANRSIINILYDIRDHFKEVLSDD